MRLATPILISMLVFLLPVTTAGAIRHTPVAPTKCAPGHRHLIAANTQAQVFAVPEAHVSVIRGCAYGHKKSFVIGGAGECGSQFCNNTSHIVLTGAIVACENSHFVASLSEDISEFMILVLDLRTGRVLHKVPTGNPRNPRPGLVGTGEISAIVVKSDGAVAWIVEAEIKPKVEYEVYALDKSGSRVLASGRDIVPSSLALAGSTLYWMQGGKPFSATLN